MSSPQPPPSHVNMNGLEQVHSIPSPSPPPIQQSQDETVDDDDDPYIHPDSDVMEDLGMYRQGGFHPIHLSDILDNGRFKIVHKLGSGGFATVWLARDRQFNSYVAWKIHQAEDLEGSQECRVLKILGEPSNHPGKQHVPSLLHSFTLSGPNGTPVSRESSSRSESKQSVSIELETWQKGSTTNDIQDDTSPGVSS